MLVFCCLRLTMEIRPALSVQRSGAKQLTNLGVSAALSSSLPVLPTTLEEPYPKLPVSQQVSMERDFATRPLVHTSHLPSSNEVVGHIFSSSAGFSTDLQFSSVSPQERHSSNTPFISQPSQNEIPLSQPSPSGLLQSASSTQCSKENSAPWCPDSLPGFLEFSSNTSVQNNQIESNSCSDIMGPEDFSKRNDWQDWADQLITDDEALTPNWNELLAENSVPDAEPKVG